MPTYERPAAAHPMIVRISTSRACASFNYRINRAGDYNLDVRSEYGPIPEKGDVFGIVAHLVRLARLANSGVAVITVTPHSVFVSFSEAVPPHEQKELLRKAIRAAGLGVAC